MRNGEIGLHWDEVAFQSPERHYEDLLNVLPVLWLGVPRMGRSQKSSRRFLSSEESTRLQLWSLFARQIRAGKDLRYKLTSINAHAKKSCSWKICCINGNCAGILRNQHLAREQGGCRCRCVKEKEKEEGCFASGWWFWCTCGRGSSPRRQPGS